MSSISSNLRKEKTSPPMRINPLLLVCRDTQKRSGHILKVNNRVRSGIKNTRHYDWTYPCRDADCKKENTTLEFYNMDTIDCSQQLQLRGLKVAAMNMANPDSPTNWEGGVLAQEECLMYRTTYALSLDSEYEINKDRRWSYPLKEIGGVYSPDNLVIKAADFSIYDKREDTFYVDFVAIAALRCPRLKKKRMLYEYDVETTKEKMRAFFRICHMNGIDCPVAGALGCGVFGNPPEHIGLLWSEVINEPEFRHMFKVIAFAILDGKSTNNFGIIKERIKFDDSQDDSDKKIDWYAEDNKNPVIEVDTDELLHKYYTEKNGSPSNHDKSPPLPIAPTSSRNTSPFQATLTFDSVHN